MSAAQVDLVQADVPAWAKHLVINDFSVAYILVLQYCHVELTFFISHFQGRAKVKQVLTLRMCLQCSIGGLVVESVCSTVVLPTRLLMLYSVSICNNRLKVVQ